MTNQAQRWCTIRQASLELGVSELTIRRRIKDGKTTHRLENGKYYVRLETSNVEAEPEAESHPGQGEVPPVTKPINQDRDNGHSSALAFDLDALLGEQRRLAELAGRAGLLEQQLREVEQRYSALHEGALALANRNGWLESKLEEREQTIKLLTDSERKVSWWKRLLGAGQSTD